MKDLLLTVIGLLTIWALLSWVGNDGITVVVDGVPHHYQLIVK